MDHAATENTLTNARTKETETKETVTESMTKNDVTEDTVVEDDWGDPYIFLALRQYYHDVVLVLLSGAVFSIAVRDATPSIMSS